MPPNARMVTIDVREVAAPCDTMFDVARAVDRWPRWLVHYRAVTFVERAADGGGVVCMSANRPFGLLNWPTSWTSEMQVRAGPGQPPEIRFRHIRGVTRGMQVLWNFVEHAGGTRVTILHMWNGPSWPLIGAVAARSVIGPVFVHGIASRTLAGLAQIAEDRARSSSWSGA
jgi:hypothetical protein